MKSLIVFAVVLCSTSAFANTKMIESPLMEPIQKSEYKLSDLKEYKQAPRTRSEYTKFDKRCNYAVKATASEMASAKVSSTTLSYEQIERITKIYVAAEAYFINQKCGNLLDFDKSVAAEKASLDLMINGKIPGNDTAQTTSPSSDRNADSKTTSGEGSSGRNPHPDSSCQYRGESDYAGCGSK